MSRPSSRKRSHSRKNSASETSEKKPGLLRSLFSPGKMLDGIRKRKVHIQGSFVLLLATLLTSMTLLPIFIILTIKTWSYTSKGFTGGLWFAFTQTVLLAVGIPFFKWLMQSYLIHFSLKPGLEKELEKPDEDGEPREAPKFSVVLFARTMGLLPILFFLPLKVILIPPTQLMHHIFFPPLSSMLLTGLDKLTTVMKFPVLSGLIHHKAVNFFLLNQATPYIRPSFWISISMLVLTFWLTWRKMKQLSSLSAGFLFFRTLLAVVLWDLLSMAILVGYSLF